MKLRRSLQIALITGLAVAAMAGTATAGRTPALTLISEPQAGVTPFLKLIGSARHSIELTMYELYDTRVEQALGAAARRGVDVRVLLNGGYWGDDEFESSDHNGPAYDYLRHHGVHVRWTRGYFALTHQKTLSVDGRVSAVMTLNFDGEYSTTRDFAVLDRRAADVREVVRVFDADWAGQRTRPGKGTGDLIWSPGAAGAVERIITGARRSLDVEDEELDYSPITDDLCAAARRRVRVDLVMTYDSEWRAAFAQLRRCGVSVHLFHGQSYYIHAKVIIADGSRAIVSSQNFSYTSLFENRELGISVTAHQVIAALQRGFSADYKRS